MQSNHDTTTTEGDATKPAPEVSDADALREMRERVQQSQRDARMPPKEV